MSKKILVDQAVLGRLLRALTGEPHWIRELQATRSIDEMMPSQDPAERNPINVLIEQFNDPANVVDEARLAELSNLADKTEELLEAKRVLQETYVIVGELLTRTGEFDSERGEKLLDNLSQSRQAHTDLLPWAYPEGTSMVLCEVGPGVEKFLEDHLHQQRPATQAETAPAEQPSLPGFAPLVPPRALFPSIELYPTSDPKYSILNNRLVVTATHQPVDDPIFIFRAKDRHLPAVLDFYIRQLANPMQRYAVSLRQRELTQWQQNFSYLLKEPDTVLML